ncbi:MAG TPA: acetyl-CoA carboxylase biotin carboxylase subunit [Pseudomonadota bacterium]|jgi:acetyl-CoA carboxylase biotin carboxylase subunit|nr:acetyl-CoA carboxylase biotin carboxylase subunit [Pseudomonadota bacterium]HNI58470.1 acetyl-CoA carboxylase biotin carboxylase subunit [Pseudomonadota bacterium]HNK45427.1 acetyl-CoA carboxylase biotin carboxylase subunit [Pseudomonadota bacterium]HNN49953.1 acetyl-CoA carboxylase biotin carboxylase subunit [Pseudomonadota bacterium]
MTTTQPNIRPIRKILIANRGEIAVRVIRACRELGIRSVAVYSDADRGALHVRMADEAYHIGPPPPRESYLDMDKVADTAVKAGADAVHPGYGFLSERAEFVEACEKRGLIFIGPPAQAMRQMGEKTRARIKMQAAGVPTVPGDNGIDGRGFPTVETALVAAEKIGFPVMLKAAAGGGGRGMRLCESADKFPAAFESAKREAKAAFGDDTVYLEKAIIRPRHVEIQVFGDRHGNHVYLFERDCSVQRRNQKVIEESPCPVLDEDLRRRMGEVAARAAAAVDYVGAGTCEFLLSEDRNFYFLEMNTRLQVEHPVTELVTGLDLVHLQIRVAEGHPLPFRQQDLMLRGAAIECRVCAEDSLRFLPSPGKITRLRNPSGPWVRNDSGVYQDAEISMFYDNLISKLIVWAPTRAEAIERMSRALSEYQIGGIKTNLGFHRRVMQEPDFRAGRYNTGYIEAHKQTLLSAQPLDDQTVRTAAIAAAIHASSSSTASAVKHETAGGTEISAWRAGWPAHGLRDGK